MFSCIRDRVDEHSVEKSQGARLCSTAVARLANFGRKGDGKGGRRRASSLSDSVPEGESS